MKKVKEIMVPYPQYCGQHETLQTVAEKMSKSNIGSLPVVDENKNPIGIVTDRDICMTAAAQSKKTLSELKVQAITDTQKVYTCSAEDNLQTALKIMRTEKVGRLPVVDHEQKLTGIVSLNHIVRKTHGSSDEAEIVYEGKENVMKTLHSLASRKTEMTFIE